MTDTLRKKNEDIIQTNTDMVCKKIKKLLESIPFEDLGYMRSQAAEQLITESLIWGSFNAYEAIGICESSKLEYIKITEEVYSEEKTY